MRAVLWFGVLCTTTMGCSVLEGAEPDAEDVVGRTYVVDFAAEEVEINHAVWVLQQTMDVYGVLLQPDLEADDFVFAIGLGERLEGEGELLQMPCLRGTDWGFITFDAPTVASEEGDSLPFLYRYEGDEYQFTLLEATIGGTFTEDGGALEGVTIDAWFDVSEVDPYVEGEACDLLPVLGLECGACPGQGETCIKASIEATEVPERTDLAFDPAYDPLADPACGG